MPESEPISRVAFADLLELEPHGPDTYVGPVARYPWGGRLFGGQVVAQALRAAIETVPHDRPAHSLHSYFIRAGSSVEPIRFEVERLRDGRSFCTRQVVARQSSGAILNVSVSFQTVEDEADVQLASLSDDLPPPDDPAADDTSWSRMLLRRQIDLGDDRVGSWIRLDADLGDDRILHTCGLAFMSDAAPARAGRAVHPDHRTPSDRRLFVGASLDHSIWFHRETRADRWHWFDTRSHGLHGGRGTVTADVLSDDGVHVATIAQEILLRRARDRSAS